MTLRALLLSAVNFRTLALVASSLNWQMYCVEMNGYMVVLRGN